MTPIPNSFSLIMPFSPLHDAMGNTFTYDGWNLTGETSAIFYHERDWWGGHVPPPVLLASSTNLYIWGLDLSGTMQDAGGAGGLLAVLGAPGTSPASVFVPAYDANGNVTEYVDANGSTAAHYEYDAFGNTLAQSGPMAEGFRFRFSTKYLDDAFGWAPPYFRLYYYGRRHYSPYYRSFISADPIEERGGLNLYGFCGNDPINRWDYLGLQNQLFLTFDDGPIRGTDILLNDLKATGVKATFFVQGSNFSRVKIDGKEHMGAGQIQEYIRYLKRIIDEGHLLGSHSYWHKPYSEPQWMFDDFVRNLKEIEKVLGKPLPDTFYKYIRLPGSNTWRVENIKQNDPMIKNANAIADLFKGVKIFGWDIEWKPGTTAKDMAEETKNKFKSGAGKIPGKLVLLAHDKDFNGKSGLLEEYIKEMKKCIKCDFFTLESY